MSARLLWQLIERRAEATPDDLMSADERGVHQSFKQYRDAAGQTAAWLLADGVLPGSVVAWQMPTWIETLVLVGALALLDVTQVPMLPIYRDREISHAVRATHASTLILPRRFRHVELADQAERALATTDSCRILVIEDRALPSVELDGAGPDPVALDEPDPVRWVFFTSGTTADPKGARHTDGTVLAAMRAYAHSAAITGDDRVTLNFPVAHIGGIQLLMLSLELGVADVLLEHFVPEAAVEVLARERVTLPGAGTAFHVGYLQVQRAHPGRLVLPDARAFPGGGAPMSAMLFAQVKEATGVPIVSNYGLTECPNATGSSPDAPDDKLASTVGRASPGVELRVVGPDGAICGPGQEGELWLRGPQLCQGYLDAALTSESFDGDGWFRTGDLVTVDVDGYVRIVGRLKDIIVRKGENISAREIEECLDAHPKVAESAVLGVSDERTGEMVCAFVVPHDAADPPSLEDIAAFMGERGLMRQKIPERLLLVGALPRNPLGKVVKRELRARLAATGPAA